MYPTKRQYNAAEGIRKKMTGWPAIDAMLRKFCQDNPRNDDRFIVLIKVRLVNRFYYTRIIAEDQLAQNIAKNHQGIDGKIAAGDTVAVRMVAECGKKKVWSFASKFVHFHRPETFPIWDKYVGIALRALGQRCWRGEKPSSDKDFEMFRLCIDSMAKKGKLTLKQVDEYLWLRGQRDKKARNATTKLSGEVEASIKAYTKLWQKL